LHPYLAVSAASLRSPSFVRSDLLHVVARVGWIAAITAITAAVTMLSEGGFSGG